MTFAQTAIPLILDGLTWEQLSHEQRKELTAHYYREEYKSDSEAYEWVTENDHYKALSMLWQLTGAMIKPADAQEFVVSCFAAAMAHVEVHVRERYIRAAEEWEQRAQDEWWDEEYHKTRRFA